MLRNSIRYPSPSRPAWPFSGIAGSEYSLVTAPFTHTVIFGAFRAHLEDVPFARRLDPVFGHGSLQVEALGLAVHREAAEQVAGSRFTRLRLEIDRAIGAIAKHDAAVVAFAVFDLGEAVLGVKNGVPELLIVAQPIGPPLPSHRSVWFCSSSFHCETGGGAALGRAMKSWRVQPAIEAAGMMSFQPEGSASRALWVWAQQAMPKTRMTPASLRMRDFSLSAAKVTSGAGRRQGPWKPPARRRGQPSATIGESRRRGFGERYG